MIVKCPSDEANTIGAFICSFICDHLQENRAQRRPYQKKILHLHIVRPLYIELSEF